MGGGVSELKDDSVLLWLTGSVSASDVNFKAQLEQANRATVEAALEHVAGTSGNKVREKALRQRLAQLVGSESSDLTCTKCGETVENKLALVRHLRVAHRLPLADAVKGAGVTSTDVDVVDVVDPAAVVATAERQERTTGMELATLQEEREFESQQVELQNQREQEIAEAYETAGIIKGLTFVQKVVTVSNLVRLDLVKKTKAYKGIGTWQDYCNHVGIDRATIDGQLKNLHKFGEEFLLTVSNFGMSYRDMRKLRQLSDGGAISIDAEYAVIGEERIPIDADHAPDLQVAIERLLEQGAKNSERLEKLERKFDGAVDEETKGLKDEVKDLVKENRRLKKFDPENKDRGFFLEQAKELDAKVVELATLCSKFLVDERVMEDPVLLGQVEGYFSSAELMLRDVRKRWEGVVSIFED